jgi:ribosomal protein S6
MVKRRECSSIPINTIEVLRKRVENTATTIRNNRGMLEKVEELFRRRLHYIDNNNGGHFEHFLQWLVITA